ncbi:alpha/beta hydrolase family protein [Bizionia sediminis]|uniref:Alpha/beta hydrolase family protein n=1 Tax=Bizionia sediminis TaxID=1737064 RepID=A0ABW5KSX3_9FLAO
MPTLTNQVFHRNHKKPLVWDAYFNQTNIKKPLVVFCHGYKGFKDWGCWHLVAKAFQEANLFFVKFNFSHNGGTIENPIDFPDLEAFAENNYSKELDDLNDLLHALHSEENPHKNDLNLQDITLIGHSRGGGIATIYAAENRCVNKLITWASVSDFGKRTATTGDLEAWKKTGVKYVLNGRTKQQMPHNYQFYEDFKANETRLNLERAAKTIGIPHLIIHGTADLSVPFKEAEALHTWNPKSILLPIKNANHVFNAAHPWETENLPTALQQVVRASIAFSRS